MLWDELSLPATCEFASGHPERRNHDVGAETAVFQLHVRGMVASLGPTALEEQGSNVTSPVSYHQAAASLLPPTKGY